MSNPSKQRGTRWETDIQNTLRDEYHEDVERTAQTGADDESDLVVRDGRFYILIEAKNHRQLDLASFVDQALAQRDNFAKKRGIEPRMVMPIAVVKRRNKSTRDAYVVTTLHEYFRSA